MPVLLSNKERTWMPAGVYSEPRRRAIMTDFHCGRYATSRGLTRYSPLLSFARNISLSFCGLALP